jgi:thiol:disulfide interchange protein DsbA
MNNKFIHLIFILACLVFGSTGYSQDSLDGKYAEITPPQPTQTGDKIEVMEVFWYGCPHCYSFEPHLEAWLKELPEDVQFIRVPGVLNRGWIPHAKAYYVAAKLGIVDKIHRPLFDAIHKEKRRLFTEDEIMDFFVEQGVAADEYERIINSKELDTKIRQAYFLARDYKLTGVPSIVVNGKYLVSASHIRTFEEMIQVIQALVERERN